MNFYKGLVDPLEDHRERRVRKLAVSIGMLATDTYSVVEFLAALGTATGCFIRTQWPAHEYPAVLDAYVEHVKSLIAEAERKQ